MKSNCLLTHGLVAVLLLIAMPLKAATITANQDTHLSFSQPPRLSEAVLAVAQSQQRVLDDVYWPAAGLYRKDSQNADRIADLQPVRHQITVNTGKTQQQWKRLYRTLTQLTVAERINRNIDPDFTRITPAANPLLNGTWHLQLPHRPTTIMVLGDVKQPGEYAFTERQSVRRYLEQAGAETIGISQALIIMPSGERSHVPIAYWNERHQDLLPGSIIYLPLPEKAIDGFAVDTNEHVLTYLQHRLIR